MEEYRTEEEQVEALRRWWDENGRSTIAAIVIALSVGFGWQAWKSNEETRQEGASDIYQTMLQALGDGVATTTEQQQAAKDLGGQLKADFSGSTYAQFAALHLAAMAVNVNDLAEAEAQLRWVLSKAAKGSDTGQVAQLRLARVLAASGDTDQALAVIDGSDGGAYQASYAVARGDIMLSLARNDEARAEYTKALTLTMNGQGQVNLPALEQKLQSLSPVPQRTSGMAGEAQPGAADATAVDTAIDDTAVADAVTTDSQED